MVYDEYGWEDMVDYHRRRDGKMIVCWGPLAKEGEYELWRETEINGHEPLEKRLDKLLTKYKGHTGNAFIYDSYTELAEMLLEFFQIYADSLAFRMSKFQIPARYKLQNLSFRVHVMGLEADMDSIMYQILATLLKLFCKNSKSVSSGRGKVNHTFFDGVSKYADKEYPDPADSVSLRKYYTAATEFWHLLATDVMDFINKEDRTNMKKLINVLEKKILPRAAYMSQVLLPYTEEEKRKAYEEYWARN